MRRDATEVSTRVGLDDRDAQMDLGDEPDQGIQIARVSGLVGYPGGEEKQIAPSRRDLRGSPAFRCVFSLPADLLHERPQLAGFGAGDLHEERFRVDLQGDADAGQLLSRRPVLAPLERPDRAGADARSSCQLLLGVASPLSPLQENAPRGTTILFSHGRPHSAGRRAFLTRLRFR